MERLNSLNGESLTANQKKLVNRIKNGPRKNTPGHNPFAGPFGPWIRIPELGEPLQALGAAIRFNSPLDDQSREIAICTIGLFYRSRFEVAVHLKLAIRHGVDKKQLEKLCRNEVPHFPEKQQVAHMLVTEMLKTNGISDTTYQRTQKFFSEEELVALVSTVGYYCLISHTLNAFNIPLEPGMDSPF